MKWGIAGYLGYRNFGDDAMLLVVSNAIRRIDSSASFVVFGRTTDKSDYPALPGDAVFAGNKSGIFRLLTFLRDIDTLVVCGGTCLHNRGFCNLRLSSVAWALGKEVYWIGVGADSVKGRLPRMKAKLALRLCRQVAVRNRESSLHINELLPSFDRVQVTGELAYLMPELLPDCFNSDGRKSDTQVGPMVIAWRALEQHLTSGVPREIISIVARAVVEFADELGIQEISVVSLADVIDNRDCHAMSEELNALVNQNRNMDVNLLTNLDFREKVEVLRGASIVFSARMHGYLVAKLLDVPAVGLVYAEKVGRVGEQLSGPALVGLDELKDGWEVLRNEFRREIDRPSRFNDLQHQMDGARQNVGLLKAIYSRHRRGQGES